ncbi:hypothetical protein BRD15_05785 [Halobacteriales archaeon SW_6_65_15]|nr:MAG: hypothetical protein BRD15_05785 [Halobacteriales archaeon SW_6_65_15]
MGYVDYKYLTDEGDDTAFITDDGEGYREPDDATAEVRPAPCLSLGVTMDLGDRYPREMGDEYANRLYERVGGRDVLFDDTDDSVGTKIARMYALGVEEFAVVGDRERDADVLEVERTSDGSSEERTLDALSGA